MRLEAHSIAVDLPGGWDGRIHARPPEAAASGGAAPRHPPATLQAASFPLPPRDGDFGSRATASMSGRDAFLAVTEYIEGNGLRAGSGLFRNSHFPRALRPEMFRPETLLVGRRGQLGFQHFFTAAGRPFCLYAVLGSASSADASLVSLNRVLRSLTISPRH